MKAIIVLVALLLCSCVILKEPGLLLEDELFRTRRYVGQFVTFAHDKPQGFGSPHLIWIRTDLKSKFGDIVAYSRRCEFVPGERIYIRRIWYSPSVTSGYWMYQIEGELSQKHYRLRQFQLDNKILVQSWF